MKAAVIEPLSQGESDALRALGEGKQMLAERTYPFAHKAKLESFNERSKVTTWRPVALATIDRLIRLRLVDAKTLDHPKCDRIEYLISLRGREAIRLGKVLPQ